MDATIDNVIPLVRAIDGHQAEIDRLKAQLAEMLGKRTPAPSRPVTVKTAELAGLGRTADGAAVRTKCRDCKQPPALGMARCEKHLIINRARVKAANAKTRERAMSSNGESRLDKIAEAAAAAPPFRVGA